MFRIVVGFSLIALTFVALLLWDGFENDSTTAFALPGVHATTMYDTACGCCGSHIEYMEEIGMRVDKEATDHLESIKDELGIPAEMRSCHTTMIEGYVVEGHMPSEAIAKLLDEKPEIRGIVLPGMPSGSPGMPGSKNEIWVIYALEFDGSTSVFMEI